MSGCSVCVYDLYGDALEEYRERLRLAKVKAIHLDPPVTRQEWPEHQLGLFPTDQARVDQQEREHEAHLTPEQKRQKALDDQIDRLYPVDMIMDPVMAAFYELERKVKHKQAIDHPELVQAELEEVAQPASEDHKKVQEQLAREEVEVEQQRVAPPAP